MSAKKIFDDEPVIFVFKVSKELKRNFKMAVAIQDTNASIVLREFMENYSKKYLEGNKWF